MPGLRLRPANLWQFRGQRAGAILGEDQYHVVLRHIGGKRAPAALASSLISALDQHGVLIAIHADSPSPDPSSGFSSVDFLVQGDELQVIHSLLDGDGRVVAVELRRPGMLDIYDVYSRSSELIQSLRAGKTVERIDVVRQGHELIGIDLLFENGTRTTIDTSDFYEEVTGC